MPKTVSVQATIDHDTLAAADAVLQANGLLVSDAIEMLMEYVAREKRLPFPQMPNAITVQAMRELDAGKGRRFEKPDALFKALDI